MQRCCLTAAIAALFLGSCATDASKPPVPTAYEIEQTKRYELDKREEDRAWR
jgi:outer membrane biogenesis lipoprotein LolB